MRLAPNLPPRLRKLGTSLAERPVRPAEVDTSEACGYLRPLQQRQIEELGRLLQRSFSEWRTCMRSRGP